MAGASEAKLVRSLPRPTVQDFSPQSTLRSADGTSATTPLDAQVPVSDIRHPRVAPGNNPAHGDFSFCWAISMPIAQSNLGASWEYPTRAIHVFHRSWTLRARRYAVELVPSVLQPVF